MALCFVAGWLVSGVSMVGKLGIRFFYKEYTLFRSWWKTGLAFMGVLMIIFGVLWWAQKKMSPSKAKLVAFFTLFAGIAGLIFTYNDFQHTLTHRLLKERFHLGFYMFWLGWLANCGYYLFMGKNTKIGNQ
ncbi:MAG: cytochrome d ubiquinol oxidase subunit II [Chitinophagaceae bacterium]